MGQDFFCKIQSARVYFTFFILLKIPFDVEKRTLPFCFCLIEKVVVVILLY